MLLSFVGQITKVIQFVIRFISRQERAFKVNMVRAAMQKTLLKR